LPDTTVKQCDKVVLTGHFFNSNLHSSRHLRRLECERGWSGLFPQVVYRQTENLQRMAEGGKRLENKGLTVL